jgi:D-lactate dehydrogenase (cytochrome)
MPAQRIRARRPAGDPAPLRIERDPDILAGRLEDAAHFPGGHATELVSPESEAQIAQALHSSSAILPIGAQSSLTGGATPVGERLLSTARLKRIEFVDETHVRVQAGVTLTELDRALECAGRFYPPTPTFMGAFVGGAVATNAAGAATFKYGTTRDWVEAMTIVLPSGEVLDIERGQMMAASDGRFEIELASGIVHLSVPRYQMPALPKLSAGYFARPGMDLIDLFIGSEGTLGIVTAVTLRVLPVRPAVCLALVPFSTRHDGLRFVSELRRVARETWHSGDARGIDIAAVEHMDARCLALLKQDGLDRANGVSVPVDAAIALLVTLELPPTMRPGQAFDEIGRARETDAPDTPLTRFCRMLASAGALESVEIAVPGDRSRASQLLALREAVPAAVNLRIGKAKASIDARIAKTAADMIVPFDQIEEMLACYDHEFSRRGLDAAVWGHLSDGNLHPNVIPRSVADVESGKEAILALGREALKRGGAPLAEHGVGRNPIKQELLKMMYGVEGIAEMRRIKQAIDPECKLSPGVLFPRIDHDNR